jgi:hypothetical protein
MDDKLCSEKHLRVNERLNDHDEAISDHSEKLEKLAKSDAINTTQISNLVKSMGGLTKALWGLVLSIAGVLVGFFIWYIQSL